MKRLLLVLLVCAGCQRREVPVIDTSGFEPVIVKQIEGAVADVRAQPRSGAAWGKLGMVLHAYELDAPARQCYAHAAAFDPKDQRWTQGDLTPEVINLRVGLKAWSDKAQQLLSERKHAAAAPLIDQLVTTYPNAPDSWLLLGRLRLDQNDCTGAETALRRLLQIAPDSVNAHWQLGIALICQQRYREAVPILQRAVELKPDFGEAHFNLGFALARSGDGRAAIPYFRNAIRYNPEMIDPYITLADLLAQTGDVQQATDLLKRALQLNPADERAQTLLRRIHGQ
jgi:tetratricopeptide (TPR) repeat protein